jgi:hypothetical protein
MSKIKCLQCGQILESKSRHDFQSCDCPNQTFVDGGTNYLRSGGVRLDLIEYQVDEIKDENKGGDKKC